jgi:hypothetical protein
MGIQAARRERMRAVSPLMMFAPDNSLMWKTALSVGKMLRFAQIQIGPCKFGSDVIQPKDLGDGALKGFIGSRVLTSRVWLDDSI